MTDASGPRTLVHSTTAIASVAGQEVARRHELGSGVHTTTVLFTGPAGPARPHVHRHHDEVCVLLAGSGRVTVGDRSSAMGPGDVVVIPAGVPHTADFDEPFQMLSVYGPTDDPADPDREWIDGWGDSP